MKTARHVLLLAVLVTGCGARSSVLSIVTLPDPAGCYVLVFDAPNFVGERDFINGPAAYPSLSRLPNGASWHRRIRSLRMGPSANMKAWAHEGYQGIPAAFGYDKSYPRLTPTFSGQIESAEISCVTAPTNGASRHLPRPTS